MDNKYPLKYGVLYVLCKEKREMSVEEVMEQLKPVFGTEKQFTKDTVRFHLDSMVCVDMAESMNERFDEDGKVTSDFKVTSFGEVRSAFLPDSWRADLP